MTAHSINDRYHRWSGAVSSVDWSVLSNRGQSRPLWTFYDAMAASPPPAPQLEWRKGRVTCLRLSSGPRGGGGRDEDAAAAGIRPGWHPHLPHETAGPLSCSISGRLR